MTVRRLLVVTIDGPSGVGKSTISKRVAAALGFTYLDTGAMYRAVAWRLKEERVDISDSQAVTRALENMSIELSPTPGEADVCVHLNGIAIGHRIRTPKISMLASRVSALPSVREKLTLMQRKIGEQGRVVAEGRDTGTVVFPDAAYKFYLDATPEERTNRRVLQLRARGEDVDEAALLEMTITRDKNDSERDIAPLKKADDAVYLDTTGRTADAVLSLLLDTIEKKTP